MYRLYLPIPRMQSGAPCIHLYRNHLSIEEVNRRILISCWRIIEESSFPILKNPHFYIKNAPAPVGSPVTLSRGALVIADWISLYLQSARDLSIAGMYIKTQTASLHARWHPVRLAYSGASHTGGIREPATLVAACSVQYMYTQSFATLHVILGLVHILNGAGTWGRICTWQIQSCWIQNLIILNTKFNHFEY